jgi:hypothetical protein
VVLEKDREDQLDRSSNTEILHRAKEDRNNLHTVKRRKAKWIVYILCRNCLLEHVIEGKTKRMTDVIRRRRKRRKKLLDNLEKIKEVERGNTRS